jgi:hypothetical protein
MERILTKATEWACRKLENKLRQIWFPDILVEFGDMRFHILRKTTPGWRDDILDVLEHIGYPE